MIKVEDLEQYIKSSNKKQIFAQNTAPALELDNIWINTTTVPYAIFRCDGTSYVQIGSASSISDLTSFTTDNLAESSTKKYVSPTQISSWNNKVDKVTGKSLIADTEISRLSSVTNYDHTSVDSHMANNNIHVTSTDKSNWDAKATTSVATQTVDGLMAKTDKTKIDGISTNAKKVESSTINGNIKIDNTETVVYTHPDKHDATMITQDAANRMVSDVQIDAWNNKLSKDNVKSGDNITITSSGNDIVISSTATGGSVNNIDDTTESIDSTYSSTKILSITGDINDVGLPIDMQGKSIIEMLKANFTNANEAKNLIINAIGDTSLAETNSFEQISNYLISKKQSIVDALATKGITAHAYEDIINYATYINGIVQNSQLKRTKLNKLAGEKTTITLTNPTVIQSVCTTVLEYKPGNSGVVQYNCDFNNSDLTSFNTSADQHLTFDGKMKQDNNVVTIEMISEGTIESYDSFSATIDKTKLYKISSISNSSSGTSEIITITGTYNPILVQAKSDINLIDVDKISGISWTATSTNSSKLLMIYSIDSGITWKGYDSVNHVVLDINDINDLSEVKSKGLIIANVNSLTQIDLDNIRNLSPKIRFAYYIEKDLVSDVVENDKITLSVQMKGEDMFSSHHNLAFDGVNTLTYTFTADGTYTIIYMDNN